MIKVYSGIKGFAVILFFIAGIVLFLSIFSWGVANAAKVLLPLLIVLAYLLIIVFVLGILPSTFFIDLRPSLGVYALVMAQALGVATWMVSFLFVIKVFGLWGIFLSALFQFLAPVAIVGAIFNGSWHMAEHLILWMGCAYGMKYYSQWLSDLTSRKKPKGEVIDVDVIEVKAK